MTDPLSFFAVFDIVSDYYQFCLFCLSFGAFLQAPEGGIPTPAHPDEKQL